MRVQDGEVIAAELHLRRLAASLRDLYDADLDDGVAAAVASAAAASGRDGPARLRLDARPGAHGVATWIEVTPLPPLSGPGRLSAVTVPGGIGPHKWSD